MAKLSDWLPEDRLYDGGSYLWVKEKSEGGTLQVGIGLPTVESFGELAYLSLLEPGEKVSRGDSIGSMEAAKMTGEIVSPVSGTIVERNETVLDNPHKVSEDPYSGGWLVALEPEFWDSEKGELHDSVSLYELLPEELRGNHNTR